MMPISPRFAVRSAGSDVSARPASDGRRLTGDLGAILKVAVVLVVALMAVPLHGQAVAQETAAPTGPVLPPAPSTEFEPLPPPGPSTPGETVVPPGPTMVLPSPAFSAAPGPACVAEGYWIASSWKCRQTAPHGCSCGDLEYYYRAGDGQTQLLNRDAFHASLAPGTPVCVVVHGSFTNWQSLCEDCGPLFRWIRNAAPYRPLNVVFFTWPSAGPITYEPHLDVAILGMRASFNSVYLGDLVARIPPGHPICIVGHSHGARMAAAALHLLGGGEVDDTRLTYLPPPEQRIRGVLVAGALDHHWLDPGQRFGLALCRAECLLYLRNDHDMVLTFYPLRRVFSRRALGESGLTRRDHERLGYLNAKVAQLDVTPIVQTGHVWNHYYVHPELAAAIEPYVYFDDAPPGFLPAPASASLSASTKPANETAGPEPRRRFWPGLRSKFVQATPDSDR